jgi:hypothetical protein
MGVRADSAQVAKGAKEGNPPPGPQAQAPAQARQIPVINFDLPPQTRQRPEPTCARPQAFAGGRAVGVPVGSQAGAHGGQATTSTMGTAQGWPVGHPFEKRVGVSSKSTEQGWSLGFTVGTQAGPSINRGTARPPCPDPVETLMGRSEHVKARENHHRQTSLEGQIRHPNQTLGDSRVHIDSAEHQQKVSQPHSCNLNPWQMCTRSRQL